MRLLLVGAFPYPQHHGSQVYFQEQAIALRSLGAEITLLTYGCGKAPPTKALGGGPDPAAAHWRALDGFDLRVSPKWTTPSALASGPNWQKPLADLGLAISLRRTVASHQGNDAFDAILTHNAEAAWIALWGLPRPRPAIVYCVHTLLGRELSAYLKGPKTNPFLDLPGRFNRILPVASGFDGLGRGIDQWLARHADGWISLTQSAERVMHQNSDGPGALIPPSVPDPLSQRVVLDPKAVARRHGLEPGRFLLYSGNLDGYQELEILAAAAQRRSSTVDAKQPLVIASHSARASAGWAKAMPGVQFVQVESLAEMQALLTSARASLLTRRAEGGFPIKLVNSLAVGTPVLAFHEAEWGLEHERDSLICAKDDPVASLTAAISRLEGDDRLAAGIAAGARQGYLERHRPEPRAQQVLALIEALCLSRTKSGAADPGVPFL
jgi:glycosyltransferase involved in cell wall biosynthesis